jgi:hypothetical protein
MMIQIPYKSFVIRMASTGLWYVQKDGNYVVAAHNEQDARAIIDKFNLS